MRSLCEDSELENSISKMVENRQAIAIMGPTASGKSRLSMALAERLPVEIISVDSALIYQDMDVGTAKPTAEDLSLVSHHLIDILPPTERYSAADFVSDAKRIALQIFERGKLPLLVGGTMMYFNALQKGLSQLPEADESVRQKWLKKWEERPQSLHDYLREIDPVAADRIHPNDPQRLVRAIEVYEVSGKSMTSLQQEGVQPLTEFDLQKFALLPADRAKLHQQIELRFHQMISLGLIEEVKALREKYPDLHPDLPSVRSVGYRQAWDYLDGKVSKETFTEKGIVATRQLAKRQITWLRKEEAVQALDPFQMSVEKQVEAVLQGIP
jgi:tRNA dimethylallyltransferase